MTAARAGICELNCERKSWDEVKYGREFGFVLCVLSWNAFKSLKCAL